MGEATDEKARAEAEAAKRARDIEQKSMEQKEVEEIKSRKEEPKENEVDAEFDEVRAKEEAKAKAPRGFFNGVRPDSSKCMTIGRHENVKEEAELKAREEAERRLKEKEEEEQKSREREAAGWKLNQE